MALISILQEDNDKTYALSRSDSVEMNVALNSGFKVRFVKTSSPAYPSAISSELGIRGLDDTLASVNSMVLTHPNDTVEFMYDDVNNCFQITDYRRADLPAVVDDIKDRAAFKDEFNTFTAGQVIQPIRIVADDLPDGDPINANAATSNNVYITVGASDRIINKPTNLVDGMTVNFVVKHTVNNGGVITFGSGFRWPNGGERPILTTDNENATDIISCYYAVLEGSDESDGVLMCSVAYNISPEIIPV